MEFCSSFWTRRACFVVACLAFVMTSNASGLCADPFRERIVPFVTTYCAECHNAKKAEAELNLSRYPSAEAAAEDFRQWEHVITFVEREEMPPKTSKHQPSPELRAEILKTLRSVLDAEARKLAGDPGVVLPRRLTNSEYDHTIRDLTGVDIHPTRSFPVDPAAGEGFDNTGEALTMSPSLIAKLYAAAQHVADHALLTTAGLEFAPFPVATFADRVKFHEQAILTFYDKHKVDYESYLTACWQYQSRPASEPSKTIEDWARERGLSVKYLTQLFDALQGDSQPDDPYMGWLRGVWNSLPEPKDATVSVIPSEVRSSIEKLARDIRAVSKQICPKETEAIIANAGNAPIVHLDRRRKTARERDTFDPNSTSPSRRLHRTIKKSDPDKSTSILLSASDGRIGANPQTATGDASGYLIVKGMKFSKLSPDRYNPNDDKQNISLHKLLAEHAPDQLAQMKFGVHPLGDKVDPDAIVLAVPSTLEILIPSKGLGDANEMHFYVDVELDRAHTKSGMAGITLSGSNEVLIPLIDPNHDVARSAAECGVAFCRLFPNRFYYVDDPRGLSAGFHLIEGFFRDDQPLCKNVLSDDENRELDRLWTELEFGTEIVEKMLRGFVFFERSERNFLKDGQFELFKEEDPKLVEPEMLHLFEKVYLERSHVKATTAELATHPIHIFFEQIRNGLALRKLQLQTAQPIYLRNLEQFARMAYRRSLTAKELDNLRAFFQEVAGQEEHGVEQAVRASLIRILMSPYFGCRIDPSPDGTTVEPINDVAMASRLSYFLWSSMPDAELLSIAEAGQLHDQHILTAQVRRMLKSPKTADFAREFFGQWLGYRDFIEQESVDRSIFPDFNDALKRAMFEEPTRLATYLIQQDHPVTELLNGDLTFINKQLARHYGVPFHGKEDEWLMADGLHQQGRGGIMGMAVFLTKNSQPQRTSPVKRGFWVVHKVLGEHIPAPPADVVALPAKETDTNGKTIRELLALHVEAEKCARCHVRFDGVGLSMEGFDRIGRRRTKDLAGRPVDDVVRLADGTEAHGVAEFAHYLVKQRRDDFVRTLCRKLLGYALGRSLQLSDDVLLEQMRLTLDKNGDRFVPLMETVVLSPQFRNHRCRDFSISRFREKNTESLR